MCILNLPLKPEFVLIWLGIGKLDKCVYGLSDASLNWYCRVKSFLLELGASVSKVDPAVFYWVDGHGDVYGVLACHVDDFIWEGKPEFETYCCE